MSMFLKLVLLSKCLIFYLHNNTSKERDENKIGTKRSERLNSYFPHMPACVVYLRHVLDLSSELN